MIRLKFLNKIIISIVVLSILLNPYSVKAEDIYGGGGGHAFGKLEYQGIYSVQLPILDTLVNIAIANGVGDKEYWETNKNSKLIDLYNEVVFLYYQKYDMDTSQKGFFHNIGVTINNVGKFAFNNIVKSMGQSIRDYGITSCVGWIWHNQVNINKEFVDIVIEAMHNLGWLQDHDEMEIPKYVHGQEVIITSESLIKRKDRIKEFFEILVSKVDLHYNPGKLRLGYVSAQFNDFIDSTYTNDTYNLYFFVYEQKSGYLKWSLYYVKPNGGMPITIVNGSNNNSLYGDTTRIECETWFSSASENYTNTYTVTNNYNWGRFYRNSVGLINGNDFDFDNLRPQGVFNVAKINAVSNDNPPLRQGHTTYNNNTITYNHEYNVTSSGAVTGGFNYFEQLYDGDIKTNKDNFNADIVINPITTEIKDYIDIIRGTLPNDFITLTPNDNSNINFNITDLIPHGLGNKFPFSLLTNTIKSVTSGGSIGKSPPNLTCNFKFMSHTYPLTLDFSPFNGIIAIIRYFWLMILFASLFWVSYKLLGGK